MDRLAAAARSARDGIRRPRLQVRLPQWVHGIRVGGPGPGPAGPGRCKQLRLAECHSASPSRRLNLKFDCQCTATTSGRSQFGQRSLDASPKVTESRQTHTGLPRFPGRSACAFQVRGRIVTVLRFPEGTLNTLGPSIVSTRTVLHVESTCRLLSIILMTRTRVPDSELQVEGRCQHLTRTLRVFPCGPSCGPGQSDCSV
jgi:hypothetical protein